MRNFFKPVYEFVKETFNEWYFVDNAPRLGAALAYYSIFSVAPLVILAIVLAGLIFNQQQAQEAIVSEIGSTVGQDVADAINGILQHSQRPAVLSVAAVIGLVTLLFGASGVFGELQDDLNIVWKVEPKPGGGVWDFLRHRFLSFTMVFGVGFLLLVSLLVSAALSALGKFLTSGALPGGVYLWQAVNALISFSLITLLFAMIFKVLPDVKLAWSDVWVGAAVTAVLFTLGKYLIGLYLGRASVTSPFGAAGSLVVILIWMYYSSQILLLGAEFTRVYANRFGTRPQVAENAMPRKDEACIRQGAPPRRQQASVRS